VFKGLIIILRGVFCIQFVVAVAIRRTLQYSSLQLIIKFS